MAFVLIVLATAGVVVLGLVVIGRETFRLRTTARPAVFDVPEAVDWIAERLPVEVASRITHDDVRWVLQADVDLLEDATVDRDDHELGPFGYEVVDEDDAVARILGRADEQGRDLLDDDIAAVLEARAAYLAAIGAIGPQVDRPRDA